MDREDRFQFVNQRWRPVFDLTNDEVRGRSIYDFFPKAVADAMAENNRRVLSTRAAAEAEEVVPHPDGDHTYISVKVPLFDGVDNAYPVCGISTDITERKRAEVELRRAKEAAERAREAKSEFPRHAQPRAAHAADARAAGVSLMERDPALPGGVPPGRDDDPAERGAREPADLRPARPDPHHQGEAATRPDEVDLHLVVRAPLHVCLREGAAPVTPELRAARHTVRGDPIRLQQVFWNLVSNAMKFTPPDGSITVRSSNVDDGGGGRVRVEVVDTGAGIPPDVLARLFSAFEQGEAHTARPQAGLGLGLAISRRLAEAHGGTVTAASEGRGRGSTFTVELPVVDAPLSSPAPQCPAGIPIAPKD